MDDKLDRIRSATDLAVAWLSNPNTEADAQSVTAFLTLSHAALTDMGKSKGEAIAAGEAVPGRYVPAVSVRQSLASPDHIVSMIDGKPYTVLKKHLTAHGLTPDEYRARYRLKPDYPMVAPAMSEKRRMIAKQIGLGKIRGKAASAGGSGASTMPKRLTLKLFG